MFTSSDAAAKMLRRAALQLFPQRCQYCNAWLRYRDYAGCCVRCVMQLLKQLRSEKNIECCAVCCVPLLPLLGTKKDGKKKTKVGRASFTLGPKVAFKAGAQKAVVCPDCISAKKFFSTDAYSPLAGKLLATNGMLTKVEVLFNNSGFAKEFFYDYKFNNCRGYGKILAQLAVRQYGNFFSNFSALVPVPPSPARIESSGYCPVAEIVKHIGIFSGVPVLNLLRRNFSVWKKYVRQRQLHHDERWHNAAKTYVCVNNKKNTADINKPLLLIDDIMTSGATMHMAAAEIKRNNPEIAVYAFAVLRTSLATSQQPRE